MNIFTKRTFFIYYLLIINIVLSSCSDDLSSNDKKNEESDTIAIPTEEKLIYTASNFIRIYMKAQNQDGDIFLARANDIMKGDYEPRYNIRQGRWYLFFTSGINSLNVTLNTDATKGNVESLNGKTIVEKVNLNLKASDPTSLPLFTLVEFQKVVELPHNK